ncbi:MAG: HEPN domain-containing protein [bacterium]
MKEKSNALEWYNKAENDFKAACYLAKRKKDPLFDLVCYHCQQACEKYFKASLVFKEKNPPWTHDLENLLDLCGEDDPSFEEIREIIMPLTPYVVEYRYPGEEAIEEEAKDALERTKKIRIFIKKKLGVKD